MKRELRILYNRLSGYDVGSMYRSFKTQFELPSGDLEVEAKRRRAVHKAQTLWVSQKFEYDMLVNGVGKQKGLGKNFTLEEAMKKDPDAVIRILSTVQEMITKYSCSI